jgi:uncharacterized integral membrane protein
MLTQLKDWLSIRLAETGEIYQGQFGEFSIDRHDRAEVLIYRTSLLVSAACLGIAATMALWPWQVLGREQWISLCYLGFCLALGVSLWTIHIYLKPLHIALQCFWALGCLASIAIGFSNSLPLATTVYQYPQTIWGIGFGFAALTGIFFKEAFCFSRLETKILTLLVPLLLLGHLWSFLPAWSEKGLMGVGAGLFVVFALRKTYQQIPDDIGDKSVFAYLQNQRLQNQQG